MSVEKDIPEYFGQEGMILNLSNDGMVLFIRHTGLSVREMGFAVGFPKRVVDCNSMARVSEPS